MALVCLRRAVEVWQPCSSIRAATAAGAPVATRPNSVLLLLSVVRVNVIVGVKRRGLAGGAWVTGLPCDCPRLTFVCTSLCLLESSPRCLLIRPNYVTSDPRGSLRRRVLLILGLAKMAKVVRARVCRLTY